MGSTMDRPLKYSPELVLPELNGWFKFGLQAEITEDGHEFYALKQLPDAVTEDLNSRLYGEEFNSGFAVLQSSFWREIARLQKEGFKTGFLKSDPKFRVAGVNYTASKTILLDIFANTGVLIHEERHSFQRKQMLANAKDYRRAKLLTLSPECISEAGQFFQELDSTTLELPTWRGLFKTLKTAPESHDHLLEGQEEDNSFTQAQMFNLNLLYPSTAAGWVKPGMCPEQLKNAVIEIMIKAEAFRTLAGEGYGSEFHKFLMIDFFAHKHLNAECTTQESQNSDYCKLNRQKIVDNQIETEKAVLSVENALSKEIEERQKYISDILTTLPDEIQSELCWYAGGYENLTNCKTQL